MSYAYSEASSKQLGSKGDEKTRAYPRQLDVETDSSEESDRSSEHVAGHRPVRVTVYSLKQESDIVRIWIDEKSTYGDIREGLAHLDDVQAITVLEAVYGQKPYWIESKSESIIEPTCVHLYAVIVTEPQRYILGVVRTALSDYPIALFDSVNSPVMTVSQKIVTVQPNLTHRIKSITGYSNKQNMSDDEYSYQLLREAEASNFPTVFFITVDEAPGPFMVDASDDSIPPFLQIQFVECSGLLQRSYNLELLPLQAIHVSRAIHHLVISLAKALGGGISEKDFSGSDNITERTDIIRVAPVIAGNLQSILNTFGAVVKALEEKSVDPKALMADIRSILSALCGDYHGAVVVRHSFETFERLVRMDRNEIPLSVGNGDNGHPLSGSNTSTAPREKIVMSLNPPEVRALLDSYAPAPSSHEGQKSGDIFGSMLNAVQSRSKSRERDALFSAGYAKQTASSYTPQGERARSVPDPKHQKGELEDVDAEIARRLEKDLGLQDSEDPYRPIRRDRSRSLELTRSRERTERQDRDHYSPQFTFSATPQANHPFVPFTKQDPPWNITYREQGGGFDGDDDDSEMLGPRTDCACGTTYVSPASPGCHALPLALGTNYTASNSDHNQPSTSAQVVEVKFDGPSRTVRLSEDLEAHFPAQPALMKLALYILSQPWCLLSEEEPPITQSEPVVVLKFFKRTPKSRFESFFDGKLRCHVMEANGDRCRHVTTRKDRAVGHARAHFGYRPFACTGKCGKSGCLERYTCSSFLHDHVGRKKNPKRPCAICGSLLTAQNLKRHMKQHLASPSQVTTFSPQGEAIEAPSKVGIEIKVDTEPADSPAKET